jgi:hypothetical protein
MASGDVVHVDGLNTQSRHFQFNNNHHVESSLDVDDTCITTGMESFPFLFRVNKSVFGLANDVKIVFCVLIGGSWVEKGVPWKCA